MKFQTPMMIQYEKIKSEYSDCLLFFRLGDFYELFMEDAEIGSKILDITLTARNKGKDGKIPMCGVPFHAIDNYLTKIVNAGYKAAICEQTSESKEVGEIVDRQVVRIVTPGTITNESSLNTKSNNYIMTINVGQNEFSYAFMDISTGAFYISQKKFSNNEKYQSIINEVRRINPSEIILDQMQYGDYELIKNLRAIESPNIFTIKQGIINFDYYKNLLDFFKIKSLSIFKINEDEKLLLKSASEILDYIKYTQKDKLQHIKKIQNISKFQYMRLDSETIKNLEIFESNRLGFSNQKSNTLLDCIDKTNTPMGARLLRNMILFPSIDIVEIKKRQDVIEVFTLNHDYRNKIRDFSKKINDIERLLSKLGTGVSNGRDLISLKKSLDTSKTIISEIMNNEKQNKLLRLNEKISNLDSNNIDEIINRIKNTITAEPPISVRDGNLINSGINQELDDIKKSISQSQNWISNLESIEKVKTKISTLKVGFNSVFGYYIEVSKANSKFVPENYIRKQTLVNAERYITQELKQHEDIVLGAQDKINQIEFKIFNDTVSEIVNKSASIQIFADLIAQIDIYSALAELAIEKNYIKPSISEKSKYDIKIVEGRHPVVESVLQIAEFTPNSSFLSKNDYFHIITGPNMAGKSTYIRQVAILQLLAQIGAYIPAYKAEIAIVDGIYTRIGSGDALAQGYSTFMVEMIETAKILNNATEYSLIILDEVGRGTSTIDGLSIARSVVEYIHNKIKAKTLFATHFHELISLNQRLKKLSNYHVQVTESEGQIKFLHKVEKGGTDKSYGVEVAKLAGIPDEVIKKANQLLQEGSNPQLKLDL